MAFNPFGKPLGSDLDRSDLESLIGRVAEGYFVEFKEQLPSSRKVARGIASLANTDGGWYIVGVRTDGNNVASEIRGFELQRTSDPIATIRDIAKSRIDPMPILFPAVVDVAPKRVALVTYVPGRQRTPFVTDDGRIYRRAHDSSDPIPEDRRHAIDRLVDRGREADRFFARLCSQEREPHAVGRDNLGWVNLYLMPEPLGLIHRPELRTREGVEQLKALASQTRMLFATNDGEGVSGSLPFGHVQVLHAGVRLRQLNEDQLTLPGLAMELFMGGSVRCHIPVPLQEPLSLLGDQDLSKDGRAMFLELYGSGAEPSSDALHLRLFDVGRVLLQVVLLLRLHHDWLSSVEWWPDFRFGFSFRGFWDTVPFADTRQWRELVRDWGMPIVSHDIQVPEDWREPIVAVTEGPDDLIHFDVLREMAWALGLESELLGRSLVHAIEVAAAKGPS